MWHIYTCVFTNTEFPVPALGSPPSSTPNASASNTYPLQIQPRFVLALNVSHDRLTSRRPASKESIGVIVAIFGDVLISLALNYQSSPAVVGTNNDNSSSYKSSSTQTPVNLSRTNSNVRFRVSIRDSYGEEQRPLLGPNRCLLRPTTMGKPRPTCHIDEEQGAPRPCESAPCGKTKTLCPLGYSTITYLIQ